MMTDDDYRGEFRCVADESAPGGIRIDRADQHVRILVELLATLDPRIRFGKRG